MHTSTALPGPARRGASSAPARRRLMAAVTAVVATLGVAGCGSESNGAQGGTSVTVVAFRAPSLGAFLPAVIEDQDLDADNGLNLEFTYATPDNYNSEFGAGHYDVGGSAALLSEALRTERGANVTYLFNLFDFFGTVVTSNPEIRELPDLQGHTLAAATGTTNYAMFQWFAGRQELDLSQVETKNQTTAGLSTMAMTGRTDATHLWEPAYSTLIDKKRDIRTIGLDVGAWENEFGTADIPYLGVAAQGQWAQDNPETVQALYDTYKAAADWVTRNPKEASELIAANIPGGSAQVIQSLIEEHADRLAMNVAPASQVTDGIQAVFEAGQQIGYLQQPPPDSIIYKGLAQ